MEKTLLIITILVASVVIVSCNPQKKTAGNYTYKTECLGIEMDGSQTVQAWGNGRNRFDACEQAKKNAVADVLFKGINEGKMDCEKHPILSEPNARQKNEDYFNKFFADGGEYNNYVSLKDERLEQKILRSRKGGRKSVTHGFVVRIDRAGLKQKMIGDGIL